MKSTRFRSSEVKAHFQKTEFKVKNSGLNIFLAPASLKNGKILVITPKKSGNSVKRNLIRRRLKSIYFEDQLNKKTIDCIVIVNPEATNLNFAQIKEILLNAVKSYQDKNL